MVSASKRAVIAILALLAVINIWTYSAMAQASLPLPPPPLLQGLPELPSANPASSGIQPIEGTPPAQPAIETPPEITPIVAPAVTVFSQQQAIDTSQQGQPAPPSAIELLGRIDRLDNKVANLEEQIRMIPQPQIPGIVKSPFSFNILLIVNMITFALVVYLLFRSQEKSVGPKHKEEAKPLKNIKDYMRRYQAQGYQVENMKSFLIAQGYPRDLVEQAARDMDAEASFKF